MTCDELLLFVVKQQRLADKVVTCYKGGVLGFHLYRRFEEIRLRNYVVQPQDRDGRGKGVENESLDAAALCQRLEFAFSAGSPKTVGERIVARGGRGAVPRMDRFSASHSCETVVLFRSHSSNQRSSRTYLSDFTTGDLR